LELRSKLSWDRWNPKRRKGTKGKLRDISDSRKPLYMSQNTVKADDKFPFATMDDYTTADLCSHEFF
jgi:hypothetical protein